MTNFNTLKPQLRLTGIAATTLTETQVSANIVITMAVSWCQHTVTTEKHEIKVYNS
jgi:hypothetical protein